MNRNRSNITYSIKVASILKVVVSTAILATAGLSYVYLKNQLQQYGEIQRRLEHELTEIRTANEAVRVQITQLSSRGILEKKLAKNSLGLVRNAQARAVTVCFGLVGLFSVYSFRLIDLQIVQHEKFTTLAAEKHNHKQIIYARRGIIRDSHNEPLAENIPVKTVVADASHIRDPVAVAAAIADQLEMDPRDIASKLSQSGKGSKHIVLKAEIPEETAEKIKESLRVANLRGIYFDQDFVRVYPNGQMLSQVIGFVDHDHNGTMGIERTMQDFLQGTDGFRYIETDRTGKELVPYRGQEGAARDGCDVKLTIDLSLQNILEAELDAACVEFKPKDASAIMMRPQTGEILAMASRPTFDPNKPGEAAPDQEKNRSIVGMVEPGSTFKIVTTSAVLEEKL